MKEGPSHVDISRNTFQEEIAATEKAFSWPGWDGQGGPFFFFLESHERRGVL